MRGLTLECYNDLVEALYRSSVDASAWDDFLSMFSARMGGVWTGIHAHDHRSNINVGFIARHWDPDFVESYKLEYAGINPWNDAVRRSRVGIAQTSESLLDPRELRKSRFYNEWIRPQEDIGTGAGITIHRDHAAFIRMSGNIRSRDQEKLQANLVEVLDLLAPHLKRAFVIARHLVGQRLAAEMQIALDGVTTAVLLVDVRGHLRHANRRADVLRERGCFNLDKTGRVVFADRRADIAFGKAVDAIVRRDYCGYVGGFEVREAGGGTCRATLAPFSTREESAWGPLERLYCDRPVALLCIVERRDPEMPTSENLRRLFGLTPAEAALALALYEGETLKSFAEARGVAVQTARKQLAAIFGKTGTSQQSQLVSCLAKVRGSRPDRD